MYTPLKVTTDYSLLKSLIKIDDLILFLVEHKINACGICDDNLFGCMEFYFKCREKNIKPLIGLTIKINNNEIYLYAKNYEGLKNLFKIHEIKQTKDLEITELVKYSSNILVIIPYQSKGLKMVLSFYEDLYYGYETKEEKDLLDAENKVYVPNLKVLKKEDVSYLAYLDLLAARENVKYFNSYYDSSMQDDLKMQELINKIAIEIPTNINYMPKLEDAHLRLKNLCEKGLAKRLNNQVPDLYRHRLNYELSVIAKMGFEDYFLICYDYVLYARKNNILVNCRGSAAGSLVSFVIGITNVDPLKYNLIFERFLNPERITMPDIDIDFAADKREDVINYVKEKYGIDKVAKGITFATMKTKLVLRDLAKVLKIDNLLFEKFIKSIKGSQTLQENLENPIIQKYLENYQELKKLYQVAFKLEDLKKNFSIHASAVVISSKPLNEIIPTFINNGELITGTTDYLEACGLLKMDFLGLKNLSFIKEVLTLIKKDNLVLTSYEDPRVFNIFNSLDVEGIFQFETPAMRNFLTKFKIDSFKDLIASLALVRPGPKEYIESYNRRKKGLEPLKYIHPDLASILSETYGIILYQEQIMAILRKFGGFTYGEADTIRRAIAKKKEQVLTDFKTKFINQALKRNYSQNVVEAIYQDILKFADYGFNKSHSVSYAKFSYEMAYLKAYYYDYFILTLLQNAVKSDYPKYLNILRQRNLKIAKPSLRNLSLNFIIRNGYVYLPLTIINKINKELVLKLQELPPEAKQDYFTFVIKTKDFLNRDLLETLIKAGALDHFKLNHATMLHNLDNIYNYLTLVGDDSCDIEKPALKKYPDDDKKTKQLEEKEIYGFYLSNHPTSFNQNKNLIKVNKLKNYVTRNINMFLLITKMTKIKTKKNENMAFLEAEDETGPVILIVFPKSYELITDLKINDLVMIRGTVTKRFDKEQIIVNILKKDGDNNE